MHSDTIVALATPPGQGAIGVLRVSGDRTFEHVRAMLPADSSTTTFEPRKMYLCNLQSDTILDQAMLVFFPAPNSYTGDDLAEIFCHGGEVVIGRIIEALVKQGCRLARPGEFTRRAFENGKLDLLQAEAIHDLVTAETPAAADNALRQLDGELSSKISTLRERLIRIAALLELELDFAEEDVEFADRREIHAGLAEIAETLDMLIQTYEKGRGLRKGLRVAIVGKPNVGKSSLLNAMVGQERAIVSSQPGTTRDFIEEQIRIASMSLRIIDTAGIRHSFDEIERQGVVRTRRRIRDADIILFMIDAASPQDDLDETIAQECIAACAEDRKKKLILVRNKIDLAGKRNGDLQLPKDGEVSISALTGDGLQDLFESIANLARRHFFDAQSSVCITNLRQKLALERALSFIRPAQESCANKMSGEFIARDLRAASEELGALIGEISSEQILDEIFANFCIGK